MSLFSSSRNQNRPNYTKGRAWSVGRQCWLHKENSQGPIEWKDFSNFRSMRFGVNGAISLSAALRLAGMEPEKFISSTDVANESRKMARNSAVFSPI